MIDPITLVERSIFKVLPVLLAPRFPNISVYNKQAPFKTVYPYALFALVHQYENYKSPRPEKHLTYVFSGVCDISETARGIAMSIEELLNPAIINSTFVFAIGDQEWNVYNIRPVQVFSSIDNIEGVPIYRRSHYLEFWMSRS
jgi:hypothetical protein